jgi:hypothetical protein
MAGLLGLGRREGIAEGASAFVGRHFDVDVVFQRPEYEKFRGLLHRRTGAGAAAEYRRVNPDASVAECRAAVLVARVRIPDEKARP